MFIVRTVSARDLKEPAFTKDDRFLTKKEALAFISRMGDLSAIIRLGKTYIVTPKPRKKGQ